MISAKGFSFTGAERSRAARVQVLPFFSTRLLPLAVLLLPFCALAAAAGEPAQAQAAGADGQWPDAAAFDANNPTNLLAVAAGSDQIDLSWSKNIAQDNVLVAWSTNATFGTPSGTYAAGASIPGGGTVLYVGGLTNLSHTGLAANSTNYYKAWSVLSGPLYSSGVSASAKTHFGVPFTEGFDAGVSMPSGWSQEFVSRTVAWTFQAGGHNASHPAGAYAGRYNAQLYSGDYTTPVTKLVTPLIDLGPSPENAQLSFWHCMEVWDGDQDQLRVYYKTATNGAWTLLATYTNSVAAWTKRTLELPNPGRSYYIGFEGTPKYGRGVCVDEVSVTADSSALGAFAAAAIGFDQIALAWSKNSAQDNVMVAWSTNSTFGTPAGTCAAGDAIAGGGTVLYNGDATNMIHSGLTANAAYFYKAWSVSSGPAYSSGASASARTLFTLPFAEGFENAGAIPLGWSQDNATTNLTWTFEAGDGNANPASAHTGSYNALLFSIDRTAPKITLVTPLILLGSAGNLQLTFWHFMKSWNADQDELRVFFKSSAGGAWTLLATYTNSVAEWTQRTVSIPNPGSSCVIGFEGSAKWGRGVCIDDVAVSEDPTAPESFDAWVQTYCPGLTATNAFVQDRNADGLQNGFEYAFGTNLTAGMPLLNLRSVSGQPVVEIPKQLPETVPHVSVCVEMTRSLSPASWSTNGVGAIDAAGEPTDRDWFQPDLMLTNGFFRLRGVLK